MTQLETANPIFGLVLYPTANEIRVKQQDVTWTSEEITVKDDIQDFRHNMSKPQYNLVTNTLLGFVETEQLVGDVWLDVARWFPHSEIDGCATVIAAMEKGVHANFYQQMSDVLNIDPVEEAERLTHIQSITSKLSYLKSIMQSKNRDSRKQEVLAVLSFTEQVLLFSNFASLKSFQANGYNLMTNVVTGVKFVIQDEQIHGVFASYLFNTHVKESGHRLSQDIIYKIANEIVEHEFSVIDFNFGNEESINSIKPGDLKSFIKQRIDFVLTELGYETLYNDTNTSIADWFFKGSKAIALHDFFVSGTNQYRRNWNVNKLSRLPFLKGDK